MTHLFYKCFTLNRQLFYTKKWYCRSENKKKSNNSLNLISHDKLKSNSKSKNKEWSLSCIFREPVPHRESIFPFLMTLSRFGKAPSDFQTARPASGNRVLIFKPPVPRRESPKSFSQRPSRVGKPCFDFQAPRPASGNPLSIFVWPFPASGRPFQISVGPVPRRDSPLRFRLMPSRVRSIVPAEGARPFHRYVGEYSC